MYSMFPPSEIRPQGWLRRQLQIQADGLSGNLDRVWRDIRDSAWVGGDAEGWERVPYWLDGFIPLAFLLEDEDKKARAERYIREIISRQEEDGWICPCKKEKRPVYDLWAYFLIGKVLALYCQFTNDEKAEQALYRAMKCLYDVLRDGSAHIFFWGKFRWFEAFVPLIYLYERYPEKWIADLGELLRKNGADYGKYEKSWEKPKAKWTLHTHIVNLAMMIKSEALTNKLLGGEYNNLPEHYWELLTRYNGTAVGNITGDECLAGKDNNRGSELCSITELMYSFETLYAYTGEAVWADRLERVAFNALPAAVSEDMWTHQYDQMVNQIACRKIKGKATFGTNSGEAHLFGLEPNFGCCTANFNQGWPKLCMNVFLKGRGEIVSAMMLPSALNTAVDGVSVAIVQDSGYPFRNCCKYTVSAESPVEFAFKIRIPAWAQSVRANGKEIPKEEYYTVKKQWSGTEIIELELLDTPRMTERPYNLYAVEYGALVYSLPIKTEYVRREYTKNGVERKYPYCDYELIPASPWNYGFASESFTVTENDISDIPFSAEKPPISLTASVCRIDWRHARFLKTVAAKKPRGRRALSPPEEIRLIPYGCAKLRMTEMPKTVK